MSNPRSAVLAVIAVLGACSGAKPDRTIAESDRKLVRDAVAAARAKAKTYAEQRIAGLQLAWHSLEPGDGPPCSLKMPVLPPLPEDSAEVAPAVRDALDLARFHMNVVSDWAVLGDPIPADTKPVQRVEIDLETKGPRFRQIDGQSEMVAKIVDDGKLPESWTRDQLLRYAHDLPSDDYWGWELDIVASVYDRGTFDASNRFMPGHIVGKALLWSFKDGRVVCAARVDATNQDTITLRVTGDVKAPSHHQRLDDDLRNQAYRAAIAKLTAVAP